MKIMKRILAVGATAVVAGAIAASPASAEAPSIAVYCLKGEREIEYQVAPGKAIPETIQRCKESGGEFVGIAPVFQEPEQ